MKKENQWEPETRDTGVHIEKSHYWVQVQAAAQNPLLTCPYRAVEDPG